MQILKVMNNSLVLALDHAGNECILMGKGIGYRQAIGDVIEEDDVEKVFLLKDKKVLLNFVQLASELDDRYFNLVKEIIDYAQQKYHMEVMDYLYLSLSDHIAFVVNRVKAGQTGENFNYVDVVKRYQAEYEVGKFAVTLINRQMGIELPASEASAIGLHFVNAKLNSDSFHKEQEIAKLVKNIETIVSRSSNIQFDKDSFSYSRFVTHLNYFAERVYEQTTFHDQQSDVMYQSMIENMPKEAEVIQTIGQFVERTYKLVLSNQENIYLLVHLHRIFTEHSKR